MKAIPKDELIILLQKKFQNTDIIYQDTMNDTFEIYGDDYYKDYGCSPLTKEVENVKRKEFLERGQNETI